MTTRLAQAEESCVRRGTRLTDIRRLVLSLIFAHRGPVGAYALLDGLRAERANAAPVTIYRALEFLQANGLIHRIERLNAFVACTDQGEHLDHDHGVQFLICRTCKTVVEMEDRGINRAVSRAAGQSGFRPDHATIEVEGTCEACASAS